MGTRSPSRSFSLLLSSFRNDVASVTGRGVAAREEAGRCGACPAAFSNGSGCMEWCTQWLIWALRHSRMTRLSGYARCSGGNVPDLLRITMGIVVRQPASVRRSDVLCVRCVLPDLYGVCGMGPAFPRDSARARTSRFDVHTRGVAERARDGARGCARVWLVSSASAANSREIPFSRSR